MLGSQIVFGFSRIAIRSLSLFCHVILRVLMSRCNHCKRSWHSKVTRVHRTACIRSVTACRYRALVTVWMTVLSSAVPSVRMLDFRFENGCIDRRARGYLDTSQGRGFEPFGPMLGSKFNFGFARIAIRSLSLLCLVILRDQVSRCNHGTRSKHSTPI